MAGWLEERLNRVTLDPGEQIDVDGGRVASVNWNGYRHFNRGGTMLRRLTGYEPHLDWCRTRQRSDMLGIVARTLLAKLLPGI